jgi:hypothetical protein
MNRVLFKLSMPNNNAWNGKWTGAGRNYTITKKMTKKKCQELGLEKDKSKCWYHNFGDGWTACVEATILKVGERSQRSDGFCGYGWMVDNIIWYNNTIKPVSVNVNEISDVVASIEEAAINDTTPVKVEV